jgi:uncharacterized FlgJ-related protein
MVEIKDLDGFSIDTTYLYRLVFVFLVSFFTTYLYLSYAGMDKIIETRSLKKAIAQFYRDGLIISNPKDLYYYLNIDKKKLIFDENTVYIKR